MASAARAFFAQLDVDEVLAYHTNKVIIIKDRWLGAAHLLSLVAVVSYFLAIPMYRDGSYLKLWPVVGSTAVQLGMSGLHVHNGLETLRHCAQFGGPVEARAANTLHCLRTPHSYMTSSNAGGELFVPLRFQHELYHMNCLQQEIMNSSGCSSVMSDFYVSEIDHYTVVISHAITDGDGATVTLGSDMPSSSIITEQDEEPRDVTRIASGEDVLSLGDLLWAAGLDLDDLGTSGETYRQTGVVLQLDIDYKHDPFGWARGYEYKVTFLPLQAAVFATQDTLEAAKGNDVDAWKGAGEDVDSSAGSGVDSSAGGDDDAEPHLQSFIVRRASGMKFLVRQTGLVGEITIQSFVVAVVASFALLRLCNGVVDQLLKHAMPLRDVYRILKWEQSVDFSDYRRGDPVAIRAVNEHRKKHYRSAGHAHAFTMRLPTMRSVFGFGSRRGTETSLTAANLDLARNSAESTASSVQLAVGEADSETRRKQVTRFSADSEKAFNASERFDSNLSGNSASAVAVAPTFSANSRRHRAAMGNSTTLGSERSGFSDHGGVSAREIMLGYGAVAKDPSRRSLGRKPSGAPRKRAEKGGAVAIPLSLSQELTEEQERQRNAVSAICGRLVNLEGVCESLSRSHEIRGAQLAELRDRFDSAGGRLAALERGLAASAEYADAPSARPCPPSTVDLEAFVCRRIEELRAVLDVRLEALGEALQTQTAGQREVSWCRLRDLESECASPASTSEAEPDLKARALSRSGDESSGRPMEPRNFSRSTCDSGTKSVDSSWSVPKGHPLFSALAPEFTDSAESAASAASAEAANALREHPLFCAKEEEVIVDAGLTIEDVPDKDLVHSSSSIATEEVGHSVAFSVGKSATPLRPLSRRSPGGVAIPALDLERMVLAAQSENTCGDGMPPMLRLDSPLESRAMPQAGSEAPRTPDKSSIAGRVEWS